MENEESKNENQTEVTSKVKNTINLTVKIIFGLGFIFFIYKAAAHKYGW